MLLCTCATIHACIYNNIRSEIFLHFKQQVNLEFNVMLKRDKLFTWPDFCPGCVVPNMSLPIHQLSISNGLSVRLVLKSISLEYPCRNLIYLKKNTTAELCSQLEFFCFYRLQTKLREGDVFTHFCLFTRGYPSIHLGRGLWIGVLTVGVYTPHVTATAAGGRHPLECMLVWQMFRLYW